MSTISSENTQCTNDNSGWDAASNGSREVIIKKSCSGDSEDELLVVPVDVQEKNAFVARKARIIPRAEVVKQQDNVVAIDDDDDKKRRRRSSLLRRSLSSSCLNKPSQGGRPITAPTPELLQAAALEDKKKKTRNYSIVKSDFSYLSNFDEGDECDEVANDISLSERSKKATDNENYDNPTPSEASKESKSLVGKDATELVDDSLGEEQLKSKLNSSASEKHCSDDSDSVTTATSSATGSSLRSLFKRGGSYSSRGTASIHHVVNPLDVTVKLVKSKNPGIGEPFDAYELLPNHTGNNRVDVMVSLQCDAFINQVEQDSKKQLFIQQTEMLNNSSSINRCTKRITNRVCQEVVHTVQEYWQGHFFVQVEQDGVIGYKKLSQKEALQAVYDIFQQAINPPEKNDAEDDKIQSELPATSYPTSNKAAPALGATVNSLVSSTSTSRVRSPSDASVSMGITAGHDDSMSLASQNTKNTNKTSGKLVRTAIAPVVPENEDVHKSALASLQRRKQRQYATSKISNLVTGRGLIQQKPDLTANHPRNLSDITVESNTKRIPRQQSAPITMASDSSLASSSSLPTTFEEARNRNRTSGALNASQNAPEGESEVNMALPSVKTRRKSEQPMMMQAAVRRSLGINQLKGINEDGEFDGNGMLADTVQKLGSLDKTQSELRRSSSSAVAVDISVLKAIESTDEIDLEPFQTAHKPHEMSAALQQFQELFSTTDATGLLQQQVHQYEPSNAGSAQSYGFDSNIQAKINNLIENPNDALTAAYLLQNENMLLQQQLQQQQQQHQLLQSRQLFTYNPDNTVSESQYQPYNPLAGNVMYQSDGIYNTNQMPFPSIVQCDESNQSAGIRRSSTIARRSSRLSEFSHVMIQELVTRLNENQDLNDDDERYFM
jgi:hypothetical protein